MMDAIVPIGPMMFVSLPLLILYLIARFYSGGKANPATYRNCRNITIVTGLIILANSIFLGLPIHGDPDTPGNIGGYGPDVLLMAWPVILILFLMILDVFSLHQHILKHTEI